MVPARCCARASRTLRLGRGKGADKSQGHQGEQNGESFAFPSAAFEGFLREFPSGIPRDNFLPALATGEHSDRDSTLKAFLLRM